MIFCLILLLILLVFMLVIYIKVANKYLKYRIDAKCNDLDESTKTFRAIEKLYNDDLMEESVFNNLMHKYMIYIREERDTLDTLKGPFGVFFAFLV